MKKKTKLIIWLVALVALLVVLFYPTNYYLEVPGSANEVSQFVKINQDRPKADSGHFYLMTVGIRQATVIDYLLSYTRPYEDRVSKQELMGNDTSEEYDQMQAYYMTSSQNSAISVAYRAANRSATKHYLGVYVMGVLPSSGFKNKVRVGDTILKIDGHTFKNTTLLMQYVKSHRIGTEVSLELLRQNKKLTVHGQLTRLKNTKRAGIGITLVDHDQLETKPKITIDAGDIGGPSAGLMFSLDIYQQLTGENLTHGQKIAGTGTIDDQGKVGIIGGADKKVVAADKAGAKVFFVPTDVPAGVAKSENNYLIAKRTAKAIHSKMKIVPVKTFQDALNYLKQHN